MLGPSLFRIRPGELSDRRFEQLVLASLAIGFFAVAVTSVIAVNALRASLHYTDLVTHTYQVIRENAAYRALSEQAEAARRGVLLSGQERFINSYQGAIAGATLRLEALDALTVDNPAQARHVRRLRTIDKLQRDLFSQAIAQVRVGDRVQAAREFGMNSNPELVFAMREITAKVQAEEDRLLAIRNRERDDSVQAAFIAMGVAGIVLIAVGIGSFWVIRRYTLALQSSRNGLAALNEGLEDAVADRTSDLARANEEIQRFAYIVSHDLRSPLVNVMGFTSELQAAAGPLNDLVARAKAEAPHILTEEAETAAAVDLPEAIGFIRSSTQKMDRLINAILRLSREGRRVLTPEPLNMEALLDGIVGSLRHRIDGLGAEVIVEPPVPSVVSDRVAVEQVLSNLIENAVKYLAPGRPGRIVVRGQEALGRVVYEVQDNGRGIDPKDHERVFELFRRSGVQDQPGEGIGLAHVRALAYRLGGLITCESALDQGATFRLSLPAKINADQGPQT